VETQSLDMAAAMRLANYTLDVNYCHVSTTDVHNINQTLRRR